MLLGIDTSTTATKALLIDDTGSVLGVASASYGYETPRPLWSEQDASLWWTATIEAIRSVIDQTGVDPAGIRGVGLTGQMHGLVLLDQHLDPLRPAILWNDQRTQAECDLIRERLGKRRLVELTGNDALTGFTAPKILWVRRHEPELYARARHVLLPKDYVRLKLTGELATDKAGAAGTLLLDLQRRDWSGEVLDALDIDRNWMPPTHEGPAITGRIHAEAARATGLLEGTPIVAGGGDQAAAAVGTGAVTPGIVSISLGTSGVVFAATDAPNYEPDGRLHAFCHAVPDTWHFMGVMLSAAGSLRWYRDTLAAGTDFDALLEPAAALPAGSDGLLFLPYLTGERTPHPDPDARGAFVGLTVRHTRAHLTRAVLEGVSFGLRDSFELMREAGLGSVSEARVTGGGAKSPLWRQLLADILGIDIVTLSTDEGAAFGAALLAGVGTNVWPDVPMASAETVRLASRTTPQNPTAYTTPYAAYRRLYPALKTWQDTP
ncbi:MAG: xylulokinase [Bacteroidota bacterium]